MKRLSGCHVLHLFPLYSASLLKQAKHRAAVEKLGFGFGLRSLYDPHSWLEVISMVCPDKRAPHCELFIGNCNLCS